MPPYLLQVPEGPVPLAGVGSWGLAGRRALGRLPEEEARLQPAPLSPVGLRLAGAACLSREPTEEHRTRGVLQSVMATQVCHCLFFFLDPRTFLLLNILESKLPKRARKTTLLLRRAWEWSAGEDACGFLVSR